MQSRLAKLASSSHSFRGEIKGAIGMLLPGESASDKEKFKAILQEMVYLPTVGFVNNHTTAGYTRVFARRGQIQVPLASHQGDVFIPRHASLASRVDVDVIDYDRRQLSEFLWRLSTDEINLLRGHFGLAGTMVRMMGADYYRDLTVHRNRQAKISDADKHAQNHIMSVVAEVEKPLLSDFESGLTRRVVASTNAITAGIGRRFLMHNFATIGTDRVIDRLVVPNSNLIRVLDTFLVEDPIGLMSMITDKKNGFANFIDMSTGTPTLIGNNPTARSIVAWLNTVIGAPPMTNWQKLTADTDAAKAHLTRVQRQVFLADTSGI